MSHPAVPAPPTQPPRRSSAPRQPQDKNRGCRYVAPGALSATPSPPASRYRDRNADDHGVIYPRRERRARDRRVASRVRPELSPRAASRNRPAGEPTGLIVRESRPARARAISDTDVAQDSEALPETRASDDEIPACVGTATKEEFMRWMTTQQALPAQKLELVVDLPEGRGLVATEEVRRGESLLDIPESTLITVERAIAESNLGPAHANLQEWSVLAAFLAEQALAIDAGADGGRFATYVRALPRRTGGVLTRPEEDVKELLAGSPSQRAAMERQASVDAAIDEIRASTPSSRPERFDGHSTCSSRDSSVCPTAAARSRWCRGRTCSTTDRGATRTSTTPAAPSASPRQEGTNPASRCSRRTARGRAASSSSRTASRPTSGRTPTTSSRWCSGSTRTIGTRTPRRTR